MVLEQARPVNLLIQGEQSEPETVGLFFTDFTLDFDIQVDTFVYMESTRMKTRAGEMFVREAGRGLPLVAVHGALSSGLSFAPLLERPPDGCRFIAPDLPGHGESPSSDPPFESWTDLSDRILALLDAMSIDEVCLLGHSMGGGISVVTAATQPERVRGLILLNSATTPFSLPLKGRIPLIPILGGLVFNHIYGKRMFFKYFQENVFHDARKVNPERLLQYYRGFDRDRATALRAVRVSSDVRFVAEQLPRIACPTLVAWGREDRLIPLDAAEQTAREIPRASLALIDDCGHSPLEEQPERTRRIIASFWEEIQNSPEG